MSIPEIEKLLGHSLDDDQMNRDFSLDRAEQTEYGLRRRGIRPQSYPPKKQIAQTLSQVEMVPHDSCEL